MVKAIRGCLIETEPSIKEVICNIGGNENFLIEEIDDTHVFITEEASLKIKQRISKIMALSKE